MTETLAAKKCTPCRGGIPPLTHEEAERFQSQTPNWELRDGHRIERTFRFRNFQEALGFVRDVGNLAETEGHHPDLSFGWGYATISLRTKKIKGLHENDFIMASKVDRIFGCAGYLARSSVRSVNLSHGNRERSCCHSFWRNRLSGSPYCSASSSARLLCEGCIKTSGPRTCFTWSRRCAASIDRGRRSRPAVSFRCAC